MTPKASAITDTPEYERWLLQSRTWTLPIVMVPNGYWVLRDQDLARQNNRLHRAIRRFLLSAEGPRCSACRFPPEDSRGLAAHEVYELDLRRRAMAFIRYRLLCKDCHYLTHSGFWAFQHYRLWKMVFDGPDRKYWLDHERRDMDLMALFCMVNGCSHEDAYHHAWGAFRVERAIHNDHPRRGAWGKLQANAAQWHTDWSALSQYQGKLGVFRGKTGHLG
jgi:hypothetical protein